MEKTFLNPPDLPNWENSFSQIVTVKSGGMATIYISGQVSVDKDRNLIGAGDLSAQASQAFGNLKRALSAAGATVADVVKICIYVMDYEPVNASVISEAFRQTFSQVDLPASTWLGVTSLAQEGFLIEVDAIACVEDQ
jgi:enamine deaminase RidA (YjgF/YER057c/UK114 family)